MNIVVVLVFWTVLRKVAYEYYKGDSWKIVNSNLTHIMPGLSVLVNLLITDVTMRASHCKVLPIFGALYGYVNYSETKKRGSPLYWFLSWTDITTSIAILAGLILLFMSIFVGISLFITTLKRPG